MRWSEDGSRTVTDQQRTSRDRDWSRRLVLVISGHDDWSWSFLVLMISPCLGPVYILVLVSVPVPVLIPILSLCCTFLYDGPGPGPRPSPGPSPRPNLVPVLGPNPSLVIFLVLALVPVPALSYFWSRPWSRSQFHNKKIVTVARCSAKNWIFMTWLPAHRSFWLQI